MPIIYSPIVIIFSAFITGLAQHPINMGWLAWFSLIPFIFVLNRIIEIRHFIISGFIWGCTYYLTVIFWLATNLGTTPFIGMLSMIAAVLYGSLTFIIICILMKLIKNIFPKHWYWFFPLVWVSIEYIRNMDLLSGGLWTALANTQLDFLILIQNAEITGIYGISFWIVIINILFYNWLVKPYLENMIKAALIFILPWMIGVWLMPTSADDSIRSMDIALIQPNIHLDQKWKPGGVRDNIQSLLNVSRPAIENNVDLIVWPETATSGYILQGNEYYIKWIQKSLNHSKLISGIPYYNEEGTERKYYNSAVFVQSDSIINIYHKIKLVPMAEYIPLSDYFPSLNQLNLGQANFTKGSEFTIMDVNNIKCAVMICFESTLPSLNREFVNAGAEVLLYVVNDGWYENPPGPQQHAKQAVFRAIENRRPIIRCTNTGISMIIDTEGNITHELPLNEKGIIQAAIKPNNIATFYTRHGDIFAQLNIMILLIMIFGGMIRKR